MRSVLALVLLLVSSACFPLIPVGPFSTDLHFHPVDGGAPLPGRINVHFGWQSATVVVTLPDGGAFQGEFDVKAPAPDREMAPAWDRVFGQGYFDAKVLGSPQHVRVALKGPEGREMKAEFHSLRRPEGGVSISEGVAVDAQGRVFKMGQ
jgi:hypothetical protein